MKISEAQISLVDTETTGTDPQTDHLVEEALRFVYLDGTPLVRTAQTLVRPPVPIPATASAVHHLTDEDVAGAPDRQAVAHWNRLQIANHPDVVMCAHNAAFDRAFLPELASQRWLCTYRLALHVWPDAPKHSNQVLRYWLGHAKLDLEGLAPHRAPADLIVTEAVLRDAVEAYLAQGGVDDIDALIAYAESPVRLVRWPLGKFRQQPIEAADTGYIQWALGPRGMVDMSPDLRFTLEQTLRERMHAA